MVTGAAGFIGSHVAEHCLKLGMHVTATDNLSGGFLSNVPAGCVWIKGDLKDDRFVNALFECGGFDYVYHLGAYAAESLSHFVRRHNYMTNLTASVNLINAAVNTGCKCFIFTSSIAVYGAGQSPMTEDMTPLPVDPYGISKYAVELDLKAAHKMFGLNYIIFRPHNVYGERQNIADKYRNVVGIFMNQILHGRPMTLFGDGLQTRAFSHVDDVAPIIARSPLVESAHNETFNIGADQEYTVLDLAHIIAGEFKVEPLIAHLPARNETVHAFSNHDKVRKVFQHYNTVPLRTGIGRMCEWIKSNGKAAPIEFENIEVEKYLPPSWRKRA